MWRDCDFRLFFGGQTVSMAGSAVSRVALPLLGALTLHAGPVGVAVLQACAWLPYLGLPLVAGVYLDRHRPVWPLRTVHAWQVPESSSSAA
jgi:hypothetical protein